MNSKKESEIYLPLVPLEKLIFFRFLNVVVSFSFYLEQNRHNNCFILQKLTKRSLKSGIKNKDKIFLVRNISNSPRRGIKPRSPAWQAGILTTTLPRIWIPISDKMPSWGWNISKNKIKVFWFWIWLCLRFPFSLSNQKRDRYIKDGSFNQSVNGTTGKMDYGLTFCILTRWEAKVL